MFLITPIFSIKQVSANDLSIKDFINLLISIGVVTPDKVPAVNLFLSSIESNKTSTITLKTNNTVVEKTKTEKEICQDSYGPNSIYSGEKNKDILICGCKDNYGWNSDQTSCQKIVYSNNKTNKNDELTKEYNSDVASINKQIVDIKNQYYKDLEANNKQAIPLQFIQGKADKLLNEANAKINQLNLKIDQLYFDYTIELNQL